MATKTKDGKLAADVLRVIDPMHWGNISRRDVISRLRKSEAPFAAPAAKALRQLKAHRHRSRTRSAALVAHVTLPVIKHDSASRTSGWYGWESPDGLSYSPIASMPDDARRQIEEAAAEFAIAKLRSKMSIGSWLLLGDGVLDISMKNARTTYRKNEDAVARVLNPLGWRVWAVTPNGFALKRNW